MSFSVNWLPETAYLFMLVFARVGTMLMLMPALGETSISTRIRLGFALVFSLVIFPLVSGELPPLTDNLMAVLGILMHELVVGLMLGAIARLIVMATQTAGAIIAFQMGLSMAQSADPTAGGVQGAMIGGFLSMVGVTLIFATDLHHLMLAATFESYMYFSPTAPLMFDDAAKMAINAVSGAFTVGVQMAAPFIVFGLVFYLGLGILARLMPQVQVFFIAMPANIGIGLMLFALLLTMMMGWYLAHVESQLMQLRY